MAAKVAIVQAFDTVFQVVAALSLDAQAPECLRGQARDLLTAMAPVGDALVDLAEHVYAHIQAGDFNPGAPPSREDMN